MRAETADLGVTVSTHGPGGASGATCCVGRAASVRADLHICARSCEGVTRSSRGDLGLLV